MKKKPTSVAALSDLGRIRLSKHFFLRDFLFSDIAAIHGLNNAPDDPGLAIAAGTQLCENLLEPIQERFGRIAIRSAYRSAEVNGFGAAMQNRKDENGKRIASRGYTCASNEANAARHIWDLLDRDKCMGATACIVVPEFWDRFQAPGDWRRLAWWIHDHLPYATMEFYPTYWAFNISWHERPERSIYSRIPPDTGYLTRPGVPNHEGSHEAEWSGIFG